MQSPRRSPSLATRRDGGESSRKRRKIATEKAAEKEKAAARRPPPSPPRRPTKIKKRAGETRAAAEGRWAGAWAIEVTQLIKEGDKPPGRRTERGVRPPRLAAVRPGEGEKKLTVRERKRRAGDDGGTWTGWDWQHAPRGCPPRVVKGVPEQRAARATRRPGWFRKS